MQAFVFDVTQIFSRANIFKNNLIELTAEHITQCFLLSTDKIISTRYKICHICHGEKLPQKNF